MNKPTFSIIVPSMGQKDLVKCLFESLGRTQSRGYELCFGFDPTGPVPPMDAGHVAGPNEPWEPDTVKYTVADKPGMSAALNAAFSLATGEWLIWLCDDFVALPSWDDFSFGLREERALCFELLEPINGSFPPMVPAGDSPENFDRSLATQVAHVRRNETLKRTFPGGFFGSAVIHRSKWIPWPTEFDPYTCNDIGWFWLTHLWHPELASGRMPGNCLYHFVRGSVRHRPDLQPDGESTGVRFKDRFGRSIDEAYRAIDDHSKSIWS